MSAPNGDMRTDSPDGHGLWIGDTRHLSEYTVRINGEDTRARSVVPEGGSVRFHAEAAGLAVERHRFVDRGMHERVTIVNSGSSRIEAGLELTFAADLVDMMALRGFAPHAGTQLEVDVKRHRLDLAPGERFTLEDPGFDAGLAAIRASYRRWAGDCARFVTDNRALNELLERSRDDLRMLADFYPTGIYPSGGIPWYAVPFGRDALITALFTLPLNPELARGTLRFLAAHQGRRVDATNEEEPGKILHEVRTGEVVDAGIWPHIFYGTVDATPLYLCALAQALDWTGDENLGEELRQSAEAALAWCHTYGDPDRDGYLEYVGGRGRNQGWKDSDDSLTNVDGSDPERPTALCEVQGYLYGALLAMGEPDRAAALKLRFNEDFWIPGEDYIAQALDGSKRRVEAATSNPGHCLWAGIVDSSRAPGVADRMLSPDLYCGWGLRTLSSRAINYDAFNGANGGVWAFDSALAAEGLRRAGFAEQAELLARSVLEAGMAFPGRRIPEYWVGTERAVDHPPDENPKSCSPQAWSAAAPFSLLATLLGLKADARRGLLHVAPRATPLWSRLEVSGLHFAGHRIDFAVEGERVRLGAIPRGITVET